MTTNTALPNILFIQCLPNRDRNWQTYRFLSHIDISSIENRTDGAAMIFLYQLSITKVSINCSWSCLLFLNEPSYTWDVKFESSALIFPAYSDTNVSSSCIRVWTPVVASNFASVMKKNYSYYWLPIHNIVFWF